MTKVDKIMLPIIVILAAWVGWHFTNLGGKGEVKPSENVNKEEPKNVIKTDSGCAGFFLTCEDGSIWVYSEEDRRFVIVKGKE